MHKIAHAARRYRATASAASREVPLAKVEADSALARTLVADDMSPGAQATRHDEEEALQSALDRLSERMRQAVLWRHHEDCSFDEIGRRLGCSNVAARKLWLRALEQIQAELTRGVVTKMQSSARAGPADAEMSHGLSGEPDDRVAEQAALFDERLAAGRGPEVFAVGDALGPSALLAAQASLEMLERVWPRSVKMEGAEPNA